MTVDEYGRLRVGDVLRFEGRLRPLVHISAGGGDFPILRCSWTRRPYRTVVRSELIHGAEVTGFRITRFRGWLAAALIEAHLPRATERLYYCRGGNRCRVGRG